MYKLLSEISEYAIINSLKVLYMFSIAKKERIKCTVGLMK